MNSLVTCQRISISTQLLERSRNQKILGFQLFLKTQNMEVVRRPLTALTIKDQHIGQPVTIEWST